VRNLTRSISGCAGILRFLEDAAIELEPAQLPVYEILRIAKTVVEGLDNLRNSGRIAFLFSARSGLGLRHVLTIADQPRMRNALSQTEAVKDGCLMSSAAAA
jgi:hypothetical protein